MSKATDADVQSLPEMTIFYDGNCLVCSTEMSHYVRLLKGTGTKFIDITEASDFDRERGQLEFADADREMHVRVGDQFVKGVDAFREIWRRVPAYTWAATAIHLPIIYQCAKAGYWSFARIRRYLPKRKKKLIFSWVSLFFLFNFFAEVTMAATFYDFRVKTIQGKEVPLSDYKGKVVLVVNTASQCGYTPQYKDLQALYETYSGQGLTILGFPSNDFGAQEPGSNEEIKSFCELNYGVKFPLFAKGPVKGKEIQPLFKFLTEGAKPGEVKWNFEKFLIDRGGQLISRFGSAVKPLSEELKKAIESKLK